MSKKLTAVCAVVAALTFSAAPAFAGEDGNTFNNEYSPWNANMSDCIATKSTAGIAAFAFDNTYMPFSIDTRNDFCGSAGGRLRILKLQRLTVDGRLTYILRGQQFQPHVHVSGTDLAATPTLQPYSVRNGNGRAPASCPSTWTFYTMPSAANIPSDMLYKTPGEGGGSGSEWANYGNPGARWGSNYTYMLWSLPRKGARPYDVSLSQGGLVMSVLKENHQVTLCDVSQQQVRSFNSSGGENGYVQFAYVRATNGYETLHGWLMVGYEKYGQGFVSTYHW